MRYSWNSVFLMGLFVAFSACRPSEPDAEHVKNCWKHIKHLMTRFQTEIRDIVVASDACHSASADAGKCAALGKETHHAIGALREELLASVFVKGCAAGADVKREFLPVLEKIQRLAREVPDSPEELAELKRHTDTLESLDENLSSDEIGERCCTSEGS